MIKDISVHGINSVRIEASSKDNWLDITVSNDKDEEFTFTIFAARNITPATLMQQINNSLYSTLQEFYNND